MKILNMNFASDAQVIDVAMRRLRVKVDEPFAPKLIHPVHAIGYVLDLPENKLAYRA